MEVEIVEKFNLWQDRVSDLELAAELEFMKADEGMMAEAFYKELEFGTAGLRGIIGAGTARMNVHTVAKASQGLANYLKKEFASPSVAIAYDSRLKSDVFARVAAETLAASGVKVYIWPRLMPVPVLSYTVRELGTSAGIVITASHNPSKYNGYKVYGCDGCQITTDAAAAISDEIAKVDIFDDVRRLDFDAGVRNGMILLIGDDVLEKYLSQVKNRSMLFGDAVNKDIAIVYSPLNGSGLEPVTRILGECGYSNVTLVDEQTRPDGNFPTCPYPNPEIREAMELGIEYAKRTGADLVLATDPDCDRVGIAVKGKGAEETAGCCTEKHNGCSAEKHNECSAENSGNTCENEEEYVLLSGNQTGTLLLDYICSQRALHGKMPENPLFLKSVVTTDLAEMVASSYGVETRNSLIGFKYIGEQITELEKAGKADSFIFGFEESYGYLSGTHARDKDGVNAALLICEMFAYYASKGVSLLDRLDDIYARFGYCSNKVFSYVFEGIAGFKKMKKIMASLREAACGAGASQAGQTSQEDVASQEGPAGQAEPTGGQLCTQLDLGEEITGVLDYMDAGSGLPPADIVKFNLGRNSVIIRPSGTEPKIKVYVNIFSESASEADALCEELKTHIDKIFE